ncbi:MAG: response regulator [Bdellovibrionales bacterium]
MKALVVEDEPAISRILTRKLKRMGYDCTSTDSIAESKKILESEEMDVVFLDYVLVDGRSKELAVGGYLEKVSHLYLMSAFMDDLEKKDFSNLNVTFLKKPFKDLASILSQVEALL